MPTLLSILTLGAATIGGVFFAFSTFIMRALRRLPPAQGIAAMQSINTAVINPLFLGLFLGTGVLAAAAAILAWLSPSAAPLRLTLAAALYILGSIGVTLVFNVPLNNQLASLDPAAPDSHNHWSRYCTQWTRWNHVRTIASLAAAGLLAITH